MLFQVNTPGGPWNVALGGGADAPTEGRGKLPQNGPQRVKW